ncbi:hypothetical protein SEEC0006_04073 [Salmonella enterica subsp. enterica serovar Choleraesuis str. 0006]|nr:hypothetical protein SEEC0006_04073 [Salmonella enterica subsp. enterica serovar Choleraesuis str. 0006]
MIVGDAHALIGGQRIIFAAFTKGVEGSELIIRGLGRFKLPGAVGCAPGGVGSGVGRCEPSDGARESRPGCDSRVSCTGD